MKITVTHDGSVPDDLRSIAKRLTDYTPLLNQIGSTLAASFRSNIDNSQTPDGKPYPPLKHPRPAGHNQDPKPLFDSGDMYRGIRHEITAPDTVKAGAIFARAVWQNRGTRTIPSRRFVGASAKDEQTIRMQMTRFIERAFNPS